MYEILEIHYVNCEKALLDYDYRKKKFDSVKEMEDYKAYLEKKVGKTLLITFIENFK